MSYRAIPDSELLTAEQFAERPEPYGGSEELIRGKVVREAEAAYDHGVLQARLAHLLLSHIEHEHLAFVCGTDHGFIIARDPDVVVSPDVALVARDRRPPAGKPWIDGAPELAIEIVSPSNTASELQEKVVYYLSSGAKLVWVVYPRRRTVAVHASLTEAHFITAPRTLSGAPVLPSFELALQELFSILE